MDYPPIVFADNDSCPCGAGKVVADCSCRGRHFVPLQVKTSPGRVASGMRSARCYAHPTGDCAGPISADHAIAQSLQLGPIVRTLSDGTKRTIPATSAGRNVLCKRHNSALSALDQVGHRFVAALRRHAQGSQERSTEHTHSLFNGFDVERWLLKVLCTMAHDQPSSRAFPSQVWRVPRPWLRVLFDGNPFPPGAGLYTPRVHRGRFAGGLLASKIVGTYPDFTRSRRVARSGDNTTVLGLSMTIYGQDFDLHMYPRRAVEVAEDWYRIRMYRVRSSSGGVSHVHLGWDDAPPTFQGKGAFVDRENVRDDLLR